MSTDDFEHDQVEAADIHTRTPGDTDPARLDPSHDPVTHDPGLAAVRTTLAWERTGLSLFACGAAIARDIPVLDGVKGQPVIGACVLALGAIVSLTSIRQAKRRARHLGTSRPAATLPDLAPFTIAIVIVGVAGTVIAIV